MSGCYRGIWSFDFMADEKPIVTTHEFELIPYGLDNIVIRIYK